MKRLLYILVASLFLFSSCDNEQDPIFEDSPEVRLNKVLNEYKTTLTKNDGNWIAYYSGSAILMKFKEDNTVEFQSTFNNGADDRTITYRVSSSQVPELVFENHSVFQAIYDKNISTGEYEFLFDKVADDRIDFVSKTDKGSRKTKLTFFKGTADDLVKAKELSDQINALSLFKELVIDGDTNYKMAISLNSGGNAEVKTLVDGKITTQKFTYEVTSKGIIFEPALIIGNNVIAAEFVYDEEKNIFQSTDEKSVSINVLNEPVFRTKDYLEFGTTLTDLRFYPWHTLASSSPSFQNFFTNVQKSVAASGHEFKSFKIEWGYADKYNILWLVIDGKSEYYLFDMVQEDGKVIFTLNGSSVKDENLINALSPFLGLFFSETGFYIQNKGQFKNYTNRTFMMISSDNPSIGINILEWL